MPARIPMTQRQRAALLALPDSEAAVVRHHGLDAEDLAAIGTARTPATRLSYALQLCCLRYPGRHLRAGELLPAIMLEQALLQRLAAVRGRLSLCADQAAAAKWWLSMPMASVSAEGPMPKALSTRRTSPLMPGCRHQGRACPLRRARMTSNPLIVA